MDKGKPYINIGTEKSCLFILLSRQLINILERNPFLYSAIEEGLQCASQGYYAAGILAYSQTLNCFGSQTPNERHEVAHEFLQHTPSQESYEKIIEMLKYEAEVSYIREADKFKGERDNFHKDLYILWEEYMNKMNA